MKFLKHFPSSTREWKTSLYSFNKNTFSNNLAATNTASDLIKSYLYLYNNRLEKKMNKKRVLLRLKRLSLNKIFVAKGEFKHTNNKLLITLYLFNRQRFTYYMNIKKKYLKIFKHLNKKLHYKLNNFVNKFTFTLLNIQNKKGYLSVNNNTDNIKYISFYFKKYLNRRLIQLKKYIYIKQLIYINKTKYNYTYLRFLKKNLEKIFNKNVEFNIINIKRFFLSSDIAMNAVISRITKNRRKLKRILKKFNQKVKTKHKLFYRSDIYNSSLNGLRFSVLNSLKHKYVYGYRFEGKGRLTRRYTASRSKYVCAYKGNLANIESSFKGISSILLKNNLKSNVDYTKLKSKTRIGSFGIKGWVSSN